MSETKIEIMKPFEGMNAWELADALRSVMHGAETLICRSGTRFGVVPREIPGSNEMGLWVCWSTAPMYTLRDTFVETKPYHGQRAFAHPPVTAEVLIAALEEGGVMVPQGWTPPKVEGRA